MLMSKLCGTIPIILPAKYNLERLLKPQGGGGAGGPGDG